MHRQIAEHVYVRRHFDDVCRLLSDQPQRVLEDAAGHAEKQLSQIVSELHVDLAGFEVTKTVQIEVGTFERDDDVVARLPIRWSAETAASWFPSLVADLEVYPLSDEPRPLTQLTLIGHYRPPLGILGDAGDTMVGRRVAEASLRHFVDGVRDRVERELSMHGVGRFLVQRHKR